MNLERNARLGGSFSVLLGLLAGPALASNPVFIGPVPYLSLADSPFAPHDLGRVWILEDFEDGNFDPPGAFMGPAVVGSVIGPSPMTDSVDADDGVIDGFGTDGHCWRSGNAPTNLVVINFDAALLGGYPKRVGIVWTDGTVPSGVTFSVIDGAGFLAGFIINTLGDGQDGTTADDRFLGVELGIGIATIQLANSAGPLEFDHLQYELPVPFRATFPDPTPYLSFADSPFVGDGIIEVQDFESGSLDTFGATISSVALKAPSPTTDSVDGDDGVIDGSGTDGWSVTQPAGTPMSIAFDLDALGRYPNKVGLVVTDVPEGKRRVRVQGFDALGKSVGFRDFVIVGDGIQGATAADRFIGLVSDVGLKEVRVTPLGSGFNVEFDHIQFDRDFISSLTPIGPTPYLSVADSPFGIADDPVAFVVIDAENGSANGYGASVAVDLLLGPAVFTDSVDADDGVIDGLGQQGHSMAQFPATPVVVTFDAAVLGGLPTRFGVVLTDGCSGPQDFELRAFGADDRLLGNVIATVVFDDSLFGNTAEDRFIGFTSTVGVARVEIRGLGPCAFELDHIQYDVAKPSALTALGPLPYLSAEDSPFDLLANPGGFVLIDAENGSSAGFGAEVQVSLVLPPAFFVDSVDGDDGTIDGLGQDGHSMAQFAGVPLVITFDESLLGGYPTKFGVVITDNCAGPWTFEIRPFDAQGDPLGVIEQTIVFDDTQFGTTSEDRFIGVTSTVPFSRVEIHSSSVCNFELDHIQYEIPTPGMLAPIGPLPYLSRSDSPFDIVGRPESFVVVDAEDGTADAFGATIDVSLIIAPAIFTDSVDGDDGILDGFGQDGHSMAQLVGTPVTVTFDEATLGGLPTRFGVVITDSCSGPWPFRLRAFDEGDNLLGSIEQVIVFDDTQFGTTGEDRFIGFTSRVGFSRVEIEGLGPCNFELDHIQFDLPEGRQFDPADLNRDGIVNGADLGLLLANWGSSGLGDINGDGTVDGADLGLLLAVFAG